MKFGKIGGVTKVEIDQCGSQYVQNAVDNQIWRKVFLCELGEPSERGEKIEMGYLIE